MIQEGKIGRRGFSGALAGLNRRRQSGGRYAGEAPIKEGRDHYTIVTWYTDPCNRKRENAQMLIAG
jgi:hypothetical protein